jgi:nucleoid DNA-binding protein
MTKVVYTPTTRPEFPTMAKSAQMEKQTFENSLNIMLNLLGELLSEGKNVEVDLHEFGKFSS